MTDVTQSGADAAPETPIVAFEKPAGTPDAMNAREAGRLLASLRKKEAAPVQTEQRQDPAAPVPESTAQAEDTGEVETPPPGETQEPDPAQQPPIEPPRSWTKEDKELFAGLPRETQERLADRERSRDTDLSRRQQEATERTKALEAERSKVEQAREQYESALPILLNNIQASMAGEFSDIKTMADVQRMANEDWPRYIRWDAQQKQVSAFQQEVTQGQQRQITEKQTKLSEFIKRETEILFEKVPELKNDDHRIQMTSRVIGMLKSDGFSSEELGDLTEGRKDLNIFDHRFRVLALDALRWREAQQKAKEAQRKPVPPVQRPGVAPNKGAQVQAQVQTLARKLENAKGVEATRIAADLMRLRRRHAR